MDLEHAESVGLLLGQEFLTWLWFASETSNGLFRTKDGEAFSVTVEQKVSVQGGEGEARETAVCSGPMAELREARMGLRTGKKVNKAKVRVERDEVSWQVLLDAATPYNTHSTTIAAPRRARRCSSTARWSLTLPTTGSSISASTATPAPTHGCASTPAART